MGEAYRQSVETPALSPEFLQQRLGLLLCSGVSRACAVARPLASNISSPWLSGRVRFIVMRRSARRSGVSVRCESSSSGCVPARQRAESTSAPMASDKGTSSAVPLRWSHGPVQVARRGTTRRGDPGADSAPERRWPDCCCSPTRPHRGPRSPEPCAGGHLAALGGGVERSRVQPTPTLSRHCPTGQKRLQCHNPLPFLPVATSSTAWGWIDVKRAHRCMPHLRTVWVSTVRKTTLSTRRPMMITVVRPANT